MTTTLDKSTSADTVPVKLIYFAWVRERVGRSDETVTLPPEIQSISALMSWLAARGPEYAEVFATKKDIIRAAINQTHVAPDTSLTGAKEIAFFPPVTGG